MDQIAEQLKAEIASLEEYIRATEERLRVTGWVSALLEPFSRVEQELDDAEVKAVVTALYQARFQFSVNGQLSGRIDEILDRYEHLVADLRPSSRGPASLPARDPDEPEPEFGDGDTAAALFTVGTEDEEAESLEFFSDDVPSAESLLGTDLDSPDESPAGGPESLLAGDSWRDRVDTPLPTKDRPRGGRPAAPPPPARPTRQSLRPVPEGQPDAVAAEGDAGALFQAAAAAAVPEDHPATTDAPPSFGEPGDPLPSEVAPVPTARPKTTSGIPVTGGDALPSVGSAGEFFVDQQDPGGQTRSATTKPLEAARRRSSKTESAEDRRPTTPARKASDQPLPATRQRAASKAAPDSRSMERYQPAAEELLAPVDVFSAKVSLDDLITRMGISIPANDRVELDHLLHNRLMDRSMAALRACAAFEKQYILIPRLSRLIHDGQTYPCTLKTLAKVFTGIFGNIQDLIQFRSFPFLTREVPEPGWALITPEAPRETLGKTYMEQNQCLRLLAATAGVPSHLVRRRTLVEAVYDLIVSRLVVGEPWQRRTLDWTATSTSKTDFVCVYFSEQGIRLRDVPRTTHNRALGFCPNW